MRHTVVFLSILAMLACTGCVAAFREAESYDTAVAPAPAPAPAAPQVIVIQPQPAPERVPADNGALLLVIMLFAMCFMVGLAAFGGYIFATSRQKPDRPQMAMPITPLLRPTNNGYDPQTGQVMMDMIDYKRLQFYEKLVKADPAAYGLLTERVRGDSDGNVGNGRG